MKLRLHGTREEVEDAARRLAEVFWVVSISEPYPDRGNSALVRVYIETHPDPP